MNRRPLAPLAVGLIAQRVDAGSVDPAVVEIEKGAHGNGEVQLFVGPASRPDGVEIGGGDSRRIMVHHVDEPEERLVAIVEPAGFDIGQDRLDERRVTKQFRRNCGVRLDSKRAVVAARRVGGDQLAQAGAER